MEEEQFGLGLRGLRESGEGEQGEGCGESPGSAHDRSPQTSIARAWDGSRGLAWIDLSG
jgi:hypothetical protein